MGTIILVVWLHFIGDFILQTDKMALNKSTSDKWLAIHVLAYSVPLLVIGWQFALVNAIAHMATDWITSRLSSRAHKVGKRGLFFKIIGADQAIHLTCLFLTLYMGK